MVASLLCVSESIVGTLHPTVEGKGCFIRSFKDDESVDLMLRNC